MNEAWDTSEIQAGRRLVHFTRVFDGTSLTVRCQPFSQQDYDTEQSLGLRQPTDRDIISCIYRADKGAYCVTSVDLIRLLEFLIGVEFEVDEKNRIRRNLEYIHPTTVSKHKSGMSRLFQQIVDYPMPKPRSIEKDVKVFPWTRLEEALKKILHKYVSNSPSPSTNCF
ncbi:hypothetical protein PUNSTDRAFT_56958 [Punctularia strigosozonata HHB-11173 SS5]|uniref:uncharacterized protein n=1 Tax=Punctularia strigosozonata (strain HHB-11173) TaxID=741275 RepID=UPI00044181C2|nr:uncharacterized protein PUNSTDRAFT_56958 [Punctularia strigosozonata HHB-11173 SS5]EIN13354.1 hypothetical protein PUNSTDRAFT_56958 [Punctularia strigosozonata HHB-11173 SS5]